MKKLIWFLALVLFLGNAKAADLAKNLTQVSIPEQVSADAVSNFVFTPSGAASGNALNLYSLTVKIGATSGYVIVYDATALPSNGAQTNCTNNSTTRPCALFCYPITSNATNGGVTFQWQSPIAATTGIVAGFSTTGCDTLTASATAKFMGQAL